MPFLMHACRGLSYQIITLHHTGQVGIGGGAVSSYLSTFKWMAAEIWNLQEVVF